MRPAPVDTPEQRASRIDALAATTMVRCALMARCTDAPGQTLRTFLSPAMERCHQLVRGWMESAGMTVSVDRAGNLRGYYPGVNDSAPRLLIGSHLDSVPHAGKYDGILGVILGISLVEALARQRLNIGIEVIGFSDEEGVRYGLPFIGSRAVVGALGPAQLARVDANGVRMSRALADYAVEHPRVVEATIDPRTRAYLEFHIEQGPVLEDVGLSLGAVDAIVGQSRAAITFRGRAGHAGTTPMTLRHDALSAAAEWLVAVESAARAMPGLVATTGCITCEPGAANVVPGKVRCTLDVRHSDDATRHAALAEFIERAQTIAVSRQIEMDSHVEQDQAGTILDPSLIALVEHAIANTGIHPRRITSGAGHDAIILAPHLPSAMIFLRSPGGISHHPDEAVLVEDVAAALRAGLNFFDCFERFLESEPASCTT